MTTTLKDLIAVLDGDRLRHLAACADARRRPVLTNPEQAAAELAAMTERGSRPTIGWWQRHMEKR